MIYFDNAATTFPKPKSVIKELTRCVSIYCGNPGRSSHILSRRAAEEVYRAREAVAGLINVDNPECVVFTYNATYALNLALKAFISPKCHIITSNLEHNAVIRPLEKAKKTLGVEYSCFCTDGDIEKSIEALLQNNTVGIVSTLASNVTGQTISIEKLSRVALKHGLFLILDASQALGHRRIDLSKTPCDALCGPAHKGIFGIQGCGFAWFRDNKRRESFIDGGSGTESRNTEMPYFLPEGYEAGTLATPAIVAAAAGIDFINNTGVDEISAYLRRLTDMLADRICSIRSAVLYPSQEGILSFNLKDIPSSVIAAELDKVGICVRGGLHCAPSAHATLGTLEQGTVRISLSFFNTDNETDRFYNSIADISKIY